MASKSARARELIGQLTVADLAARIRRRELSPVEAVDAAIERIEADNEPLNAFVYMGFADARQRGATRSGR